MNSTQQNDANVVPPLAEPTCSTTIEEVAELITGILYGGTAMTIGSCKRQANMIAAALADRRYLSNT